MPLLHIENLTVEFQTSSGLFRAVDGVSLGCDKGEILSIVGESGSGKSVSMLALMGLLPWTAKITADRMSFDDKDLRQLSARQRRKIIGKDMAMIFQEPMSSLNPCFTVGFQLGETLRVHMGLNRRERRDRSIELLQLVGIPAPEERLSVYPHQLSGGMSQRVMIAMALACDPKLLIADEPTTALDVTIQAQILELLRDLRKELSMSVMLISHDLGVIAEFAQRVFVMYAGRVVEDAPVAQLFRRPVHPYTMGLIAAVPKLDSDAPRLATIPGRIPSPQEVIPGCRFSPRCALVQDGCLDEQPSMQPAGDRQSARCPPRLLALGGRHG
jgi:dipeptide transport system ATP-binding protein